MPSSVLESQSPAAQRHTGTPVSNRTASLGVTESVSATVAGFKGLCRFCLCPKILRDLFCLQFPRRPKIKWSGPSAFGRHKWYWYKDTAPVGFWQSVCCQGLLGQQSVQLQAACEATTAPAFSQVMIEMLLALKWGIFVASSQLPLLCQPWISIQTSYRVTWVSQSTAECNSEPEFGPTAAFQLPLAGYIQYHEKPYVIFHFHTPW